MNTARRAHLRILPLPPRPTYGEGFMDGQEDGYAKGRRDSQIEAFAFGIAVGILVVGFLAFYFR